MNTPNPLIPQGTNPYGKSKLRIAVVTVLLVHAVLISGFLIQGCSKNKTTDDFATDTSTNDILPTNDVAPPTNDATAIIGNTNGAMTPTYQPANYQPPMTQPGISTAPVTQPGVSPVTTPMTPPANTTEYTVVKGDFPAKIAKQHGISTAALMAANPGLDPTKLKIGQKLQLPAGATAPAADAVVGAPVTAVDNGPVSAGSVYTVRQGDVLTRIAREHGTTVPAIVALNNLKSKNTIRVGQKLKMPAPRTSAAPAVVPAAAPATPFVQPTYQQPAAAPANQ